MTQPTWGARAPQPVPQSETQPGAWQQPRAPWPQQVAPQPGYPAPPQPPRSTALRNLLLGVALALALGFFAFSLASYLGRTDITGPDPTQPGTPSPLPVPEVPPPDANPPAVPSPKTAAEVDAWLNDNAVHAQAAAPVNCAIPGRINPVTASVAELEEHIGTVLGCLTVAWQPPLEAAGFQMPRPPLTVYTEPIATPCSSAADIYNASYCMLNQHVYYSQRFFEVMKPEVQQLPFAMDEIVAHEFGHAVQGRVGILAARNARLQLIWKEDDVNEVIRRTEVQADCFAGMGLVMLADASGITAQELVDLRLAAYNSGTDVLTGKPGFAGDHGTGEARQRWFTTGQENTGIGTCNTWTASFEDTY